MSNKSPEVIPGLVGFVLLLAREREVIGGLVSTGMEGGDWFHYGMETLFLEWEGCSVVQCFSVLRHVRLCI